MALIQWSEDLRVGVDQIDRQHEQLVTMINSLHVAMLERRGRDVLGTVFANLITYTRTHFATEEALMARQGYPLSAIHKGEHDRLTRQVLDLKADFEAGKPALTTEVMQFLRDWLVDHIQATDKKLGSYLNSHDLH